MKSMHAQVPRFKVNQIQAKIGLLSISQRVVDKSIILQELSLNIYTLHLEKKPLLCLLFIDSSSRIVEVIKMSFFKQSILAKSMLQIIIQNAMPQFQLAHNAHSS